MRVAGLAFGAAQAVAVIPSIAGARRYIRSGRSRAGHSQRSVRVAGLARRAGYSGSKVPDIAGACRCVLGG